MPFDWPPTFGDMVPVPCPFTNQLTTRQRPAVVVSTSAYAQARPDVVSMAATSQVRSTLAFAETLLIDGQTAKLLKASVVKPLLATRSSLSSSSSWARSAATIRRCLKSLWRQGFRRDCRPASVVFARLCLLFK